jgi:hypothetical protein
MRWFSAFCGAAAVSVAFAASAHANTYDFSFSGLDVAGSGVITTSGGSSPFAITGVTGTISDSEVGPGPFTITGLSSYAASDNSLSYPTQPFYTFGGFSFTTNTGGDFNIFNDNGSYEILSSVFDPGGYADAAGSHDITLSVSQTPLPPAWTMMLIGLAGFGFMMYRRSERDSVISMAAA